MVGVLLANCGQPAAPGEGNGGSSVTGGRGGIIQLTVGTTNSSSSFYAYWAAATRAANEKLKGDVQLTIVESGSTVDNLDRMRRGEFDFGNSALGTVYQAYKGEGRWADSAMLELRWFWTFSEIPYLIAVREDAGISDVKQLDGKKFSGGDIGSGSYIGIVNVLGAIDVGPNWFKGSFRDGANAMDNRQIVGMCKIVPGVEAREAMYMDIATRTRLKFVGFTPDQERRVKEKFPIYSWHTIPRGVYAGQDYEVRTFGDLTGGVANARLPQDVAYRIVKAIVETKGQQVQAFPAAESVDFLKDTVLGNPAIPLHAGTVQYLEEQGVEVPAPLVPPEYNARGMEAKR